MVLEIPDKYREEFIGFLELALTFLEMREDELQEKGRKLELEAEELAVIELVKGFIEREERNDA